MPNASNRSTHDAEQDERNSDIRIFVD